MEIVTGSEELKKRVKNLENEEFVTVDTEFMRERTYYPLLCLIQIAGKNDAFAIDPLAEKIDLKPFFNLMTNKKVIKVFHSSQQDIAIILHESGGKMPEPVFDTQIAGQMLGYGESVSYAILVKKICDVELDKSSRYTDWSKRPLSQNQISYAISDVTHLRAVYEDMVEHMHEMSRESWVDEEMKNITNPALYTSDPETIWTRIKVRSHSPRFLAIVKELAKWRELYAQKTNKPREWVLKTEGILEIAAAAPKEKAAMNNFRGYKNRDSDISDKIFEAVQKGVKEKNPPKLPKKKIIPSGVAPLVELLKVLLKFKCEENEVAPSVVAKVEELKLIAAEEKPDVPAMHGWRYDMFGKYAIALKEGKLALAADGNTVVLIEPAYE